MYQRILVPLDGTERAEQGLAYAKLLTDRFGCPITLMQVVLYQVAGTAEATRQARSYLERIAADLEAQGCTVSFKAPTSRVPALQISAEADREEGTLICMSSQAAIGLRRWFLGNIANEVLKKARSPVLVLRQQPKPPEPVINSIIAPLDGTPTAEQAIPHIETLASAFDVPVHVVYVSGAPKARRGQPDMPGYLQSVARRIRDLTDSEAQHVVLSGDPAEAILDYAKSLPGHLIVMTTHSRLGVHDLLLGAMADRLVHRSQGPILFIHPKHK